MITARWHLGRWIRMISDTNRKKVVDVLRYLRDQKNDEEHTIAGIVAGMINGRVNDDNVDDVIVYIHNIMHDMYPFR